MDENSRVNVIRLNLPPNFRNRKEALYKIGSRKSHLLSVSITLTNYKTGDNYFCIFDQVNRKKFKLIEIFSDNGQI